MRLNQSSPAHAARWMLVLFLAAIPGCGPQPISGGTRGMLTTDGNPIPDVQVGVYTAASGEQVGYAVSEPDGSFELVTADTNGPLQLDPGSYVVTLESVGAPTELPRSYLNPDSTPLRIDWNEGDTLDVNVPGLKLK